MLTTFAVTDWVKPASGPRQTEIDTADIASEGVYTHWRPGAHLFVVVDVDPDVYPSWEFTEELRAEIREAVPGAEKFDCPYGPPE